MNKYHLPLKIILVLEIAACLILVMSNNYHLGYHVGIFSWAVIDSQRQSNELSVMISQITTLGHIVTF